MGLEDPDSDAIYYLVLRAVDRYLPNRNLNFESNYKYWHLFGLSILLDKKYSHKIRHKTAYFFAIRLSQLMAIFLL